jgi:hypothetical protein
MIDFKDKLCRVTNFIPIHATICKKALNKWCFMNLFRIFVKSFANKEVKGFSANEQK